VSSDVQSNTHLLADQTHHEIENILDIIKILFHLEIRGILIILGA